MTADAPSPAVKTAAEIASERAAAMAASHGAPFTPSHNEEAISPVPHVPTNAELCALEQEVAQLKDSSLRQRADFENTRKRLLREKEEAIKFANGSLLERLLPVIDSFELGLVEARREGAAGIVQGFEMVQRQMLDFLKDSGAEAIEAEGQTFDPNLHQALGQMESETVAEGLVCQQLRKGWKLRERLLRPAMVFVSKGKAPVEV